MSLKRMIPMTETTVFRSLPLKLAAVALLPLSILSGCNRDPNVRKQKYLESGQRYAKDGKYREASLQFFNALKTDKNFGPAHYELGKAFLKMGMPTQAFPELQMAVTQTPNNMDAHVTLGNLLLQARLPDRADAEANFVLKQQPNNVDAIALQANVEAVRGNRDDAITTINKALAISPDRSDLHASLGLLQGEGGKNLPVARQELEKAVALDNKNVQAHVLLSALLTAQNDMPGAEAQLKAAIAADPKQLQPRVALAALLLREGNQAGAEQVIAQTSDDFADDPEGAGMLERYYIRSNQFPKAETAYAGLAAKHPKSYPIQIAYARILASAGKFDKANTLLAKQEENHGSDSQYVRLKAALLLHDGKQDDAFKLLQNAVRNNPDDVELKIQLGFLARDRGDLATADSNLRSALQRNPSNMIAAGGLAEIESRKGDNAGLRQLADGMIKAYPKAAAPYLWRGTANANDGHIDNAVDDLQTALKLDPKNAQALTIMAQIRLKQGKTAEGKTLLEQALAIDPNSNALLQLVRLDMQANQPAAAIALIQQQITRNPNNGNLLIVLAEAQLAAKDLHGALTSAQQAMKLNPTDLTAMRIYTQAALANNDLTGPSDMWTKWAASHPQDAQAESYLGTLAESAGDQMKAIAHYQRSLQLQPDQPVVENNLAFLMADNGQNTDVALTLAQSAQRALPNSPDASDTLAWVYYKKALYPSALDMLQRAAKTAPDNVSVQYHMGLVYVKMNNKPAAVTSFKRAVSLGAGSDTGKKAQAELDKLG
jgi:tetratricopeptide (TPR) repeat protein